MLIEPGWLAGHLYDRAVRVVEVDVSATAYDQWHQLLGRDHVRVNDGSCPEEVRKFEGSTGQLELVNLDAGPVGRATFQPGWRWSSTSSPSRRPIAARLRTRATSSPGE